MSKKDYDKAKHSLLKLGAIGVVPVLPMVPIGAQAIASFGGPRVHYQLDTDGHYVNGGLPSVPPSRWPELKKALKDGLTEPSYSGTGSQYVHLDVETDPEHADRFILKIGTVTIGYGLVDPAVEIVSTDEDPAVHDQGGDPDPDADPDDDDDTETGDTVN